MSGGVRCAVFRQPLLGLGTLPLMGVKELLPRCLQVSTARSRLPNVANVMSPPSLAEFWRRLRTVGKPLAVEMDGSAPGLGTP